MAAICLDLNVLTHWSQDIMAAILQTVFLTSFYFIKIQISRQSVSTDADSNKPLLLQKTASTPRDD